MTGSILGDIKPEPWMEDAVCRDYGEPDLWFNSGEFLPSRGYNADARKAIAICQTCPVKNECAQYAFANDEIYGIWGALTPHARRVIRQRNRRREVEAA